MISVIIPHFDDVELLQEHLPKMLKLLDASKLEFEVIVVDDFSPENAREKLREIQNENDKVRFVFKEKNTGFGATINAGAKVARGEFLFVLKNDVLPQSAQLFKTVLKHFEDKTVFSVSIGLQTEEEGKREVRGAGKMFFQKGFFLHGRASNSSKISSWADGGAQAIRKEYFDKIGGFDSIYRFYWEDVDLGFRAWKAGYRVNFESSQVLIHEDRKGPIGKRFTKEYLQTLNLRNQFIFTWKNAGLKNLLLCFLFETYNHLTSIKRGERNFIGAYWWAFLSWPQIFLARIKQKKLTRRTDKQVLQIFESIKNYADGSR